jgi:hypothetical protein
MHIDAVGGLIGRWSEDTYPSFDFVANRVVIAGYSSFPALVELRFEKSPYNAPKAVELLRTMRSVFQ